MSSSKNKRGTRSKAPALVQLQGDEGRVALPEERARRAEQESAVDRSEESALAPNKLAPSDVAPNDLALRLLGDALAREVIRAESRVVIIVSGRAGEGRTTLAMALCSALRQLSPSPVHRLTMRELRDVPEQDEGTLVIDGPALLEGDGPLSVSSAWWARIDSAIVVAAARDVPVDDLAAVGHALESRSVKRLALVANERDRPPVARALRDALNALLRRTFLARWMRSEAQPERVP